MLSSKNSVIRNKERTYTVGSLEKILLRAFLLLFTVEFFISVQYLFITFPNDYVWGEVFIKYTDGIVRRGLIGTLLYTFTSPVAIQIFWTLFITVIYVIFFTCVWKILLKTVSPLFTALLFFSPGIIAFHVKDPELYGRKDILILILLSCIIVLAARMIHTQKTSWQHYCLIAVCYCLSFLIHEITLFFSLLPALLVIRSSKNKIVCGIVIALIFTASVAFAVLFQGTAAMRDAMFHDWQSVIPDFMKSGGMKYIGETLTSHSLPFPWLKVYSLRVSYVWAWILTLIPILLLFYVYRCHTICISILGKFLTYLSYACALFPCIVLTFLISDFGRIVSYSSTVFLFFLLAILTLHKHRGRPIPVRPCDTHLSLTASPILAFTLAYLLTWKLYHYIPLSDTASIIKFMLK